MSGCVQNSIIPLNLSYKATGGTIEVVSFIKDNPDYIVDGDTIRIKETKKNDSPKKPQNENKDLEGLYKSSDNGINNSNGTNLFPGYSNEYLFKDALKDNLINQYLMQYFIIYFRKMNSKFKITFNISVSKSEVPMISKDKLKSNSKDAIDRDYSKVKEDLKSHLILELRILNLELSKNKGEDGGRFLSDYAAVLTVKGILYDLNTQKKIWESRELEEWVDTRHMTQNGLAENKGYNLRKYFQIIADRISKQLVEIFFNTN